MWGEFCDVYSPNAEKKIVKKNFDDINGICKSCSNALVRGLKFFKCLKCEKETDNYSNGVMICYDCCKESNTCRICGKEIK